MADRLLRAALPLLALAGCHASGTKTEALDNQLLASAGPAKPGGDPALTGPLADQIVVDPARARRVAPAGATLGERARAQAAPRVDAGGSCGPSLHYAADWAGRLPEGVPLYPGARVLDAAGSDAPGCAMRVVSYASAARVDRLLAWHAEHAARAGFSAERHSAGADRILAGERARDGAAFYITVTPRSGGSAVDLIVDLGR